MKRFHTIIIGFACLYITSCISLSPQQAKEKLESKGIPFEKEFFLAFARAYDIETLNMYLRAGFDINTQDANGTTALMFACKEEEGDDFEEAFWALMKVAQAELEEEKGAKIKIPFIDKKRIPMLNKSSYSKIDTIKFLIHQGANINILDKDGKNALHYVFSYFGASDIEIIKILQKHGININNQDKKGKTPLMNAARSQSVEACKFLLAHGADVKAVDSKGGNVIHNCFTFNDFNPEVSKLLLKEGADVDHRDNEGQTPLISACSIGVIDGVKTFIQLGADVNAKNKKSQSAIMKSCIIEFDDDPKIIELLIKAGAQDIDKAVLTSVTFGNVNTLKTLINNGGNINMVDNKGRNLLMLASLSFGDSEVVEFMLRNEFDLEKKDKYGNTALLLASNPWGGNDDAIPALVKDGANINVKNNNGISPLLNLVFSENPKLIKLLIDRGADINILGNDGDSPLLMATRMNKYNIVKLLLQHGARKEIKNKNGKTALDFAKNKGLIKLLK
jgi:ankyrin repeat protein